MVVVGDFLAHIHIFARAHQLLTDFGHTQIVSLDNESLFREFRSALVLFINGGRIVIQRGDDCLYVFFHKLSIGAFYKWLEHIVYALVKGDIAIVGVISIQCVFVIC